MPLRVQQIVWKNERSRRWTIRMQLSDDNQLAYKASGGS